MLQISVGAIDSYLPGRLGQQGLLGSFWLAKQFLQPILPGDLQMHPQKTG